MTLHAPKPLAPDGPRKMVLLGELCDLLGVTSTTLYRMLDKGTCPIPHRRFGKIFMFPVDEVEAFLRAETETGKSPEETP